MIRTLLDSAEDLRDAADGTVVIDNRGVVHQHCVKVEFRTGVRHDWWEQPGYLAIAENQDRLTEHDRPALPAVVLWPLDPVRPVLALHVQSADGQRCEVCVDGDDLAAWPCPTVRILRPLVGRG